jgi:hypothetical protein
VARPSRGKPRYFSALERAGVRKKPSVFTPDSPESTGRWTRSEAIRPLEPTDRDVDASGDSVSSSVGLRRSGGRRKGDVMKYRVIQWGTGFVGKLALRATIEHPDLELVGLVVHGEDKVGRDAGKLIGQGPVGVTATNDVAAAAKIDADVVSYFANADMRPVEAVQDMARMLAAGKNVVSSSVVALVYPKSAPQGLVAPLESACREGGTSCFTTGIDPGFCNDLIPMTLMGLCSRVDSVRIQEVLDYSTYPNPETLFNIMGFGQPLETTPLLLTPGALSLAGARAAPRSPDADARRRHRREGHLRGPALRAPGHRRRRSEDRRRARHPHAPGDGAGLATAGRR